MIPSLSIGPRTLLNDCNHTATAIFWRSAIFCPHTASLQFATHGFVAEISIREAVKRIGFFKNSRVRVVRFDTLHDPLWRVSGNWSFTEYGYGACTEISREYGYIPEKNTRGIPLPKSSW